MKDWKKASPKAKEGHLRRERKRRQDPEVRQRMRESARLYARAKRATPEGREAKREIDRRADAKRRPRQAERARESKSGWPRGLWELMICKQNCRCSICGRDLDGFRACADHHHVLGYPRDVLCNTCNTALGLVEKWNFKDAEPFTGYLKYHDEKFRRMYESDDDFRKHISRYRRT